MGNACTKISFSVPYPQFSTKGNKSHVKKCFSTIEFSKIIRKKKTVSENLYLLRKKKHKYNKIYSIFYIFERDNFIPYTKEKIKSIFG